MCLKVMKSGIPSLQIEFVAGLEGPRALKTLKRFVIALTKAVIASLWRHRHLPGLETLQMFCLNGFANPPSALSKRV